MRRQPAIIRLTEEDASTLQKWARKGKTEHRLVERVRIILLANEGRTNQQIAGTLSAAMTSAWNAAAVVVFPSAPKSKYSNLRK